MKKQKKTKHHEFISLPSCCHDADTFFVKTQLEQWESRLHVPVCRKYSDIFLSTFNKSDKAEWQLLNTARREANNWLRSATSRYVKANESLRTLAANKNR